MDSPRSSKQILDLNLIKFPVSGQSWLRILLIRGTKSTKSAHGLSRNQYRRQSFPPARGTSRSDHIAPSASHRHFHRLSRFWSSQHPSLSTRAQLDVFWLRTICFPSERSSDCQSDWKIHLEVHSWLQLYCHVLFTSLNGLVRFPWPPFICHYRP